MTRRILCGFPGNEGTERTNRGHAIDYTMRYCEPEIGRSITSALNGRSKSVELRGIKSTPPGAGESISRGRGNSRGHRALIRPSGEFRANFRVDFSDRRFSPLIPLIAL